MSPPYDSFVIDNNDEYIVSVPDSRNQYSE